MYLQTWLSAKGQISYVLKTTGKMYRFVHLKIVCHKSLTVVIYSTITIYNFKLLDITGNFTAWSSIEKATKYEIRFFLHTKFSVRT